MHAASCTCALLARHRSAWIAALMPIVADSPSFWPLSFAARSVRALHPASCTSGLIWCCSIALTMVLIPAAAAKRRRASVSLTTNFAATCDATVPRRDEERTTARQGARRGWGGSAACGAASRRRAGKGTHNASVGDFHLKCRALQGLLAYGGILRSVQSLALRSAQAAGLECPPVRTATPVRRRN